MLTVSRRPRQEFNVKGIPSVLVCSPKGERDLIGRTKPGLVATLPATFKKIEGGVRESLEVSAAPCGEAAATQQGNMPFCTPQCPPSVLSPASPIFSRVLSLSLFLAAIAVLHFSRSGNTPCFSSHVDALQAVFLLSISRLWGFESIPTNLVFCAVASL